MQTTRNLLQPFLGNPAFELAARALAARQTLQPPVTLAGLTQTAKGLVVAGLAHTLNRPLVLLGAERESLETLRQTIAAVLGWLDPAALKTVFVLPSWDVTPYENRSPHAEVSERRAVTLVNIARGNARIVLAPSLAAWGRFRKAVDYRSLSLEIKRGDEIGLEDFAEHLAGAGYEPREPVDSAGFYSVRGGIVDVYPPETEWPLRIEFDGDQIESIREFDPATQRSRGQASTAFILPLSEHRQRSGSSLLRPTLGIALEGGSPALEGRERDGGHDFSARYPGWEFFPSFTVGHSNSLFGLLEDPAIIWDEPADMMRHVAAAREAWCAAYDAVRDVSPAPPRPQDLLLDDEAFRQAVGSLPQLFLKELEVEDAAGQETAETGATELSLPSQPAPKFHGDIKSCLEDLEARRNRSERVIISLSSAGKVERFDEALRDYGIPFTVIPNAAASPSEGDASARGDSCGSPEGLWVLRGSIAEGVILPALGIAIFGEGDIFGGFAWGAPARKDKSAVSRFISDLSDLKPGDTVVHIDHGIGLYQGLKQIEVDGEQRDFMLLTYQEDAKLYVPLERLDLVEKYRSGTGEGGPKPALDRLGGASWARTKTRVKRALRDMTAELLRLYAERKMSGGIAFSPDTQWQKEFDDAFEFEETPDQAKALEEIKHDLESPEPMDRLLCGDVGYGKTELAMRAAFKVVQDGKQAAVLAPTTVLSFQHFSTFRRRMAGFPVRVEMISRFRSPAEQKKIIADTEAGQVDILVGTHRLLSKDVAFRDLGLLIVDEEQRFGVAAKEKLKRLRANVDVLTMSATPIPRTLHMSLGGLRDLSVIETPPQGRLAIQTTVAPYTPRLIQAAILNEIERQGQVYFVHNRVEGIFSIAAMIQQLVPKARVGVGHGQMANAELERVMMKFVQGEYDVLVSTSIIENGLDIPRANTIIINRADRFGLAELYQLRGRVGRSDRRAYAFLLIPDEDSLTPIARRRLAALKEFSDLGAGFRLAALDLELRGAGNILGGEQSGHLNAIGLDLYLKMLEETTAELKGQLPKPDVRTTMNLGVDIRIPEQYISDEGQRLRMYKRISGISGAEAGSALEAELADRYGETPQSVRTLLDYALLKNQAEAMLIQSVDRKADEVWIRFHPETPVRPEVLTRFVRRRRDAILRPDGSLRFRFGRGDPSPIPAIRSALQELQGSN